METNTAPDEGTLTILIAEDEAMVRMVAAETLRDAGYHVYEAGDGNEALAVLKTGVKIDLLLSDVKMPGLNGYQLVEASTELRPGLKVMLMTGYAQDPIPEKMAQAGVKVLYKPFNIDQLPALAERVLKGLS